MADRFPSPFEIPTPPGAEGWDKLYRYSSVFSEDRREYEDTQFWFRDGVHWPEVVTPWDATIYEYAIASLSQYNTRHYIIPPALGVDFRILNGYTYLTPVGVSNPAEVEARVPHFLERAGFYFGNWDRLYDAWLVKIRALVKEMTEISVEPLPEREPIEVITEGVGVGSGFTLQESYHRLCDLALKLWQYHFEFLNLGYAAYLDFFGFCKQAFPGIPDLAIAKMVAGVEVDLFRPDEELKKLARLAVSSGVAGAFGEANPEAVRDALRESEAGRAWLAQWDESCEPWFNFSSGSGFYHTDRVWIENVDIPFGFIRDYITRLTDGEDLARPIEAIHAERDRIVAEYRDLLGSEEDRAAFVGKLGLSRTVFPYVENHNFYVEHWSHSVMWRKMRAFGEIFVKAGFFTDVNDIFLLQVDEVPTALFDMYHAWSVGVEARGGKYWKPELARRKTILDALRAWSAAARSGQAAGGGHRAVHGHAVGHHLRQRGRLAPCL